MLSGRDGEVHVFRLAGRSRGVSLVGYRVQDLKGLAADGVDKLAVDVVLDVAGQVLRDKVLAHGRDPSPLVRGVFFQGRERFGFEIVYDPW